MRVLMIWALSYMINFIIIITVWSITVCLYLCSFLSNNCKISSVSFLPFAIMQKVKISEFSAVFSEELKRQQKSCLLVSFIASGKIGQYFGQCNNNDDEIAIISLFYHPSRWSHHFLIFSFIFCENFKFSMVICQLPAI